MSQLPTPTAYENRARRYKSYMYIPSHCDLNPTAHVGAFREYASAAFGWTVLVARLPSSDSGVVSATSLMPVSPYQYRSLMQRELLCRTVLAESIPKRRSMREDCHAHASHQRLRRDV
jgi:hypothetical protein